MIVSLAVLLLLAVLFFKRKKDAEPALRAAGKKRRVPVVIGSTGLTLWTIADNVISRFKRGGEVRKKLLRSDEEILVERANVYGFVYVILVTGALAGFVTGVIGRGNENVTEITRPGFGEETVVNLVAALDGKEEVVQVVVSGREPAESEMEAVLDRAFQENQAEWLGNNASFDAVKTSLKFSTEDDKGIQYRFESEDPELLTDFGTVLAEDVPAEGTPVRVKVTLSYGTAEKTYELNVRLMPEVSEERSVLAVALEEAEKAGRTEAVVRLPEAVGESPVSFSVKALSPAGILALFFLAAVIIAYIPASREKAELKKREDALAFSYAVAVSGLTAYIGAGMSIRSAWLRITDNYRREVKETGRHREYVYEEMLLSANELNSGVPEEEVYVRFGRRLGQHRYLKLGNLLAQNVRQGIAGLRKTLEGESREAMEERKQMALRKGEEAGTKMLAPMMILLGIVLMVLVVPAFMML